MSWAVRMLLILFAVGLPLLLYVGLRLAASVTFLRPSAKRTARRIVFLVVAWCCILPVTALFLHLLGRSRSLFLFSDSVGWLDYLFHYPVWIILIFALELLAPLLVLDLVALGGRLLPSRRPALRRILAVCRLVLATLAILYVPARVVVDTEYVRDTTVRLPVRDLPPELNNFTITLLADVQVDRYTGERKTRRAQEIVRSRGPDLLLSPGDIVTSGTRFLQRAARVMCTVKGALASVAVMGDHDFWSAPDAVRELQEHCGWVFLQNEHRVFSSGSQTILVSGLTHIYSDRLAEDELAGFLGSAPQADIRILLTHQPAEWVIRRAAEGGYHLVFAGHTHGGQVVLHPLGIPVTPSMQETRYYTGVHRIGSTAVVVTNGIGLSLAPVRYHAPAEVTTVVLEKEISPP